MQIGQDINSEQKYLLLHQILEPVSSIHHKKGSLPSQSSERAAVALCWYREGLHLIEGMTVQWVCVFHRGSESRGLFSLFTAAARHAAHWPRNEHSSDLQLWMNQRRAAIVGKKAEWGVKLNKEVMICPLCILSASLCLLIAQRLGNNKRLLSA